MCDRASQRARSPDPGLFTFPAPSERIGVPEAESAVAGRAEAAQRWATFVAELRRRRVFRVVIAYGIAAFAVLQVAEPVLHGLRLPEWVLSVIVLVLGLGLPVSIALAWIYDLTAEGVRRTAEPAATASNHEHHRRFLVLLLAASAVIATGIAVLALRPAATPAIDEQGRLVVTVADFANETADRELDGLSGMLITSLEQSRHLAVLTRARMLDLLRQAGHPAAERIEEDLGREVAQRAGARLLVAGAVHHFDEIYAIELRVLDPGRSAYLFTLAERGQGKAGIPQMIDHLSERMRLRLHEAEAEVKSSRVRVGDALTANVAAYEHYFRGIQHQEAVRYEAAVAEYRKATALDPSFALAHYRIAYAGSFGALDSASIREEISLAMRDVERVPEKEQLLIRAWTEYLDGNEGQAKALYGRAAAAYPDDKQVVFMAGESLIHLGRLPESLPYFEQAVALDPTWEWARFHVVDVLLFEGRAEEMIARARDWAAHKADGDTLKWLSRAQLTAGLYGDAEASARKAIEFADHAGPWVFPPYWARFALVDALIYQERYEEAEAILRPLTAATLPSSDRMRALPVLAEVLSYQGRRSEALRTIELLTGGGAAAGRRLGLRMTHLAASGASVRAEADEAARLGVPGEQLATLLALGGDLQSAEDRLRDAGVAAPERLLHDAVAALRRRDFEGARARFTVLTARRDADYAAFAPLGLAEIALAVGRPADAVPLLEEYGRTPVVALRWGAVPPHIFRSFGADYLRSWAYPRSIYLLALAHQRLGDGARARVEVEHLLALWKSADPDQPVLADALALRKRLSARARR